MCVQRFALWGLNKEIGKIEKNNNGIGEKKTIMETKIQAGLHLLQSRDTIRLKPFTFNFSSPENYLYAKLLILK